MIYYFSQANTKLCYTCLEMQLWFKGLKFGNIHNLKWEITANLEIHKENKLLSLCLPNN